VKFVLELVAAIKAPFTRHTRHTSPYVDVRCANRA